MILVGLAGRIGAGKSTVAAQLAAHGAVVIDADRIAHNALNTEPVRRAIAATFGPEFLDDAGQVSRPRLAAAVFGPTPGHAAALQALEAIVHPLVRSRMEDEIAACSHAAAARAASLVIVLDVPLLLQSGWAARCDRVIEVVCDEKVRRQRLAQRGWSAEAVAWRDAAWMRRMPAEGLSAVVDPAEIATVDTSSAISYTREQVDRIWSWLHATLPN